MLIRDATFSRHALDETLREWLIGGTGEGGIDVVCETTFDNTCLSKPDPRLLRRLPLDLESINLTSGMDRVIHFLHDDQVYLRYTIHYDVPKSFEGESSCSCPCFY